jgi:uncharacterized membrane protein YeaQ/YmgE (transglycosylase-associated protein family)
MTIVIWIIVGALCGLLSRIAMPVANDSGNKLAAAVGVVGALVGGAITASVTKTDIIGLYPLSILWATSGALYSLFAYRCLEMRWHPSRSF